MEFSATAWDDSKNYQLFCLKFSLSPCFYFCREKNVNKSLPRSQLFDFYVIKRCSNVSTVLSKDLRCKQIPPPKTIVNWGFFKTFLKFMMIDSKPNLIQYFKIWHRVVDSSQLVMGLMKTRRNLNFEVRRERNFIQILRYLMHLTNLS